jgi:hypothetical protein
MAAGAVLGTDAGPSPGGRLRARRQGRVVRLGALQSTSADAQAFHIDRLASDLDADAAGAGADARKASGEEGSDGAPFSAGVRRPSSPGTAL